MSAKMLRVLLRAPSRLPRRYVSTTSAKLDSTVTTTGSAPAKKDTSGEVTSNGGFVYDPDIIAEQYPKLGNRDIVGYGMNGEPNYLERPDFPYPAIRFKENTPEVMALREKEKGDWKDLSLVEKKALYRASFCSTMTEMQTQTKGQWKVILGLVLLSCTFTYLTNVFFLKFAYGPWPDQYNEDAQLAALARMFREQTGVIDGITAEYRKKEQSK